MTDEKMPERIWAWTRTTCMERGHWTSNEALGDMDTPYVLASVHQAALDENARLRASVHELSLMMRQAEECGVEEGIIEREECSFLEYGDAEVSP